MNFQFRLQLRTANCELRIGGVLTVMSKNYFLECGISDYQRQHQGGMRQERFKCSSRLVQSCESPWCTNLGYQWTSV